LTDYEFPFASARHLGLEHALTAAEMNFLLKEEGLLDGGPGDYRLTEKGADFAEERDHDAGNPNSLSYYAQWMTRLWDRSVTDELDLSPERKQQIRQAAAEARRWRTAGRDADGVGTETARAVQEDQDGGAGRAVDPLTIAVAAVLMAVSAYGLKKAAPHLRSLWEDQASPRIQQLRDRRRGEDGDRTSPPEAEMGPPASGGAQADPECAEAASESAAAEDDGDPSSGDSPTT
jgi:hypothetical protein